MAKTALLLTFAMILPPPLWASERATPLPTATPARPKSIAVARTLDRGPAPWKKARPTPTPWAMGDPEGRLSFPETSYYDRLNADLSPFLTYHPRQPSHAEKVIGTLLGAASYTCAGVAGAQALGILPSGKEKKK